MGNRKPIMTEDGRIAEKVVTEELVGEELKRITEVYVEPKIEKKLSHRITEFTRPVIHRREIETVDESTGNVETKIESIDPVVQMQLREHILSTPKLEGQNYVTRDDLRELASLLREARQEQSAVALSAAPGAFNPAPKLSMQEVVAERVEQSGQSTNNFNFFLVAVIAAQLAGVAYILFYM